MFHSWQKPGKGLSADGFYTCQKLIAPSTFYSRVFVLGLSCNKKEEIRMEEQLRAVSLINERIDRLTRDIHTDVLSKAL